VALRSAGLLAYPTNFRETFCLAVAEGQAAGLPVVTSARAALVERVDNGVDGYLIARRTERPAFQDAFVNAVLNLLSDGDSRDRMGVAAARKAHTLYDWDEIARQWESDLERLVAGRPAEAVSPDIDLLDPDLLVVTNGTESVRIPPRVAAQWLCEARASYGYGTPPRAALRRPPGPVRAQ
jgi:hypothetical protein